LTAYGFNLMNYQQVVILKEETTGRYLPIWIGPVEATAIAAKLQEVVVPRPLTRDQLQSVIEALGTTVDRIVITDLENNTFYAKIVLNVNGDKVEVDCRPSDGLALAVKTEVPIFVEDTVIDKAGILLDKETGKPIARETPEGENVSEDELRRMSAFTDFINTLDLDDFDKWRRG